MFVWVIDVLVIVFALILGSFFNVVAIRLLEGQSIVYPPSHCLACKHRLGVLELIPVLGYVLLRAKCKHCGERISSLYPLGELLTGLSFYLVYKIIGIDLELIVAWLLVAVLIISVLTDIRQKLILDVITLPAIVLLLCARVLIGDEAWWFYALGGCLGFFMILGIGLFSRGGMGGGDMKLYAAIGVVLGPWLTILSLFLASFFGALIGLVLLVTGKVKRKEPIPFAPFIGLGVLLAYLYGSRLWNWYVHIW